MVLHDGHANSQRPEAFASSLHALMAPTITKQHEPSENLQISPFEFITKMRSAQRRLMCECLLKRATELMCIFNKDAAWGDIFANLPVSYPIPSAGTDSVLSTNIQDYDRMKKNQTFRQHVLQPLEGLIAKLDPAKLQTIPLVLVFDEVANINHGNNMTPYVALRRVIRALDHFPVWVPLLSTQSALTSVSPLIDEDSSTRIRQQVFNTITPFTSFPLDIEVNRMLSEDPGKQLAKPLAKPVKDFSTVEHMATLGRPLWAVCRERHGQP